VIDLHCHVLAGIDDGPDTIEGSLAMARVAAELGTHTIVATPHVSFRYPNDSETIERLVRETNAAFADAGVALNVLAGAEIAMSQAADLDPEELTALSLGDGPWLLIECPFTSVAIGLDTLIGELEEEGHRIVLAHPERCPAFQRDPEMLESLVQGGVLTSITAGSLVGRFGGTVKRFAFELLEAEVVHNVASDAHDPEQRRPGMAEELRQAGLGGLVEWLTDAVPSALLAGEESLPPRPQVDFAGAGARRDAWWRRGPLRRAS
jgi:protein-tyrosine phosphatase